MPHRVRKAAVAGSFYPGDGETLRDEIDGFLANVHSSPPAGRPVAVVEPHAGYMYSGQVAAHGYRLLQDLGIRTAIVISPSHVEHFPFAAVFDGDTYETPLGAVPVDHELADRIARTAGRVRRSGRGHIQDKLPRREHALEVQLPFLQLVLGDFQVVPIVMGDQDWDVCEDLGRSIGPHLARPDVIVVASSDLSHFHPYDVARRKDAVFCDLLESMDPRRLYDSVAARESEACGAGPVIASIIASTQLGAARCTVLSTANSGDVTGDLDSVVGYAAAVITVPPATANRGADTGELRLDADTGAWLVRQAREAIQEALDISVSTQPPANRPLLDQKRGVFVTLKSGNRLRGCIGNIEADDPLRQTVAEMACAAAFHDPRFQPVTREELPKLTIEVSVLTPLRRIEDVGEIEIGRHGLVIDDGAHRGLLLPQVAEEYGWDAETFLEHACEKASLSGEAWKDERTRIYVFSAQVFCE